MNITVDEDSFVIIISRGEAAEVLGGYSLKTNYLDNLWKDTAA
jgi:hypothetical protein